MNKKGFTLVELLIVISVLGVILLLVLPVLFNLQKQASKTIVDGEINQSIAYWCFQGEEGKGWTFEKTCETAQQLGCKSVELVSPEDFPTLKSHSLVCAVAMNGMPDPPFAKGFNNPAYHDEVITSTKEVIDACSKFGFPGVIAFSGYKWKDALDPNSGEIPLEDGKKNCVEGLKKLAPYAEEKGVNIYFEMLNTLNDSHPMKGHPGYQIDHIKDAYDIVKQVDSPRVKLLFDIYHVQIMDRDPVPYILEYGDKIGHVHTAASPDRDELGNNDNINYPDCMSALLDIGYTGYVGHEFIPTRDPLEGLKEAVMMCDVMSIKR